jgi:NhaP-type Na+/H+ or K+/H+ antiporter
MEATEISDKATHVLKQGAGFLQAVVVNNAGSSWSLQIFDQVSAAAPAIAGATAFAVPTAGTVLAYGCYFSNGLTIVTAGTTAGSITVIWA